MNLRVVRWVDRYLGIPLVYLLFLLKKISGRLPGATAAHDCRRILLIKFWGVGNVVMLLPAALAIKDKYPHSRIDFLTLENNREVAQAAGIFDDIHTLNIRSFSGFFSDYIKTVMSLKDKDYDLVVDFEQFARSSALFCGLIGGRGSVGFKTKGQHRDLFYTKRVVYGGDIHVSKSFYSLAVVAGAPSREEIGPVPLIVPVGRRQELENKLRGWNISGDELLAVFHVGTSENFSLRRWMPEYFADLADRLISGFSAKIILTGLSVESALGSAVIKHMKCADAAVNACGEFDFGQFILLVSLSDLVVSADTAPVHLASSLSVPVVGLYGPNTPVLYGPWGDNGIWFYKNFKCSPCITNYNAKIHKCRHPEGEGVCMRRISVEEVFSGIKSNFLDEEAKLRLKKLERNEKVASFS